MTERVRRAVARVWRGRTAHADAEAYFEHLRTQTLPALEELDGFVDAFVLRQTGADGDDFVVVTIWSSRQAIHGFAGDDAERAVIPPAAARLLERWEERASHFDVALATNDGYERVARRSRRDP